MIEEITSKYDVDDWVASNTNLDRAIKAEIRSAYAELRYQGSQSDCIFGDSTKKLIAMEDAARLSATLHKTQLFSKKRGTNASMSGFDLMAFLWGDRQKLASCGKNNALLVIGDEGDISSCGEEDVIYYTGNRASIASSGGYTNISVKGHGAYVSTTGGHNHIRVTGDNADISISGYISTADVVGDKAHIINTNGHCRISYKGAGGIITLSGDSGQFKASEGTLVSAYVYDHNIEPIDIITGRVGENGLKPDTLYTVLDGKFAEIGAST